MTRLIIVGIVGSLIVAACASAGGGATSDQLDQETGQTTSIDPGAAPELEPADPASSGLVELGEPNDAADDSDSLVPGGSLPPGVTFATENLARAIGVSIDSIDWISFEEVLWPDASLGCPQPDTSYSQAIVAGSLIVFEVDGATYEYHASGAVAPFLCDG